MKCHSFEDKKMGRRLSIGRSPQCFIERKVRHHVNLRNVVVFRNFYT